MVKAIAKPKLVLINWCDHHTFETNEWRELEVFDDQTPYTVQSSGWLIRENKDHLIIAAHVCWEAGKVTGEMMILKSTVISVKPLRVGR